MIILVCCIIALRTTHTDRFIVKPRTTMNELKCFSETHYQSLAYYKGKAYLLFKLKINITCQKLHSVFKYGY